MATVVNYPIVAFLLSLILLWLSAQFGAFVRSKLHPLDEDEWKDLNTVLAATLTLLGLIIAFSFSMAISRYDQRKNLESEEANAIGTENVRAGLLPATDAARVRDLLKRYLTQRVLFYETRDERPLRQIDTDTSQLQAELWTAVQTVAATHPTPPVTLVASGMNDVLNSQGYTQAAWWNRIPGAAWSLMAAIAIFCNLLIGYGGHRTEAHILLVLPLALSIAFFLIADIDSPRGGIIRVHPRNLVSLSQSLHAQKD